MLISLRNLVIPIGIERLISLRTLNCFNISDADSKACKLRELKFLNHLLERFEIHGLANVVDVCQAGNAQLKKIHLCEMLLSFKEGRDRGMRDDMFRMP